MNDIIQTQLDRVETALTQLIDSISSYNPSIPATSALLLADDELKQGLQQLTTHQRNHARMHHLREQIAQKNNSITTTIKTLATTRADLLSQPTSLPTTETRKVPYIDLLDYAKRISRYTVPPTFRPPLPLPTAQTPAPPAAVAAAVNGADSTSPVKDTRDGEAVENGGEREGVGMGSLEEVERKWLDPLAGMGFVPWVGEEAMRSGALAEIQAMVERGEDPGLVGWWEVKEEGERMEGVEGGVEGKEEGEERRVERRAERRVEEKPKVFGGLDLYDPDEEG
ncbi:hypothetical protein JMJ35_003120 [Cladonia borealis]|uniref:Mediator of RNA polymerase II transcription subunit 4 n=1 Tax=Cladonia borealis TaxID=184061 RepID=A0AA39R437_9LECA|nr:hypothetical protein JMJ35_003120 [Cladonia borealis]